MDDRPKLPLRKDDGFMFALLHWREVRMGRSKRQKRFGLSPYVLSLLSAESENRTPDLRNKLRNEKAKCSSPDYYTIWSRSVEAVIGTIARLRSREDI